MKLRTVDIDRNGQRVRINQKDFDPDFHIVWGEEPRRVSGGGVVRPKAEEAIAASDRPVETSSDPDPDEWSELAEKLVEAGDRKPHPNTKLETLREKVADL